jgi:uncharacterized protein YcbK (DUF882 family)
MFRSSPPLRRLVLALSCLLGGAPAISLLACPPAQAQAAPRGKTAQKNSEKGRKAEKASKKERAESEEKIHVVSEGQTIGRIAKRYKVDLQALREANDLTPGSKLHLGQKLVIPSDDISRPAKNQRAKGGMGGESDRDREDSEPDTSRKHRGKGQVESTDDEVKPGFVRIVNGDESWEGQVLPRKGGKVTSKAQQAFTRVLAPQSGKTHPIQARLIALVAAVSDHFGGKTIEVVSGFRPGTGKKQSKHNTGSAIDFHIRGVSNTELRDFCKTLKKVGVGYYPNSSFVHLDVRDVSTTWVDHSRPGEAPDYHDDGEGKADKADKADSKKSKSDDSDDKEEARPEPKAKGKKAHH